MTWINHPALRDLRYLSPGESRRIASERMAALGDFMGQFHVLETGGRRYLVEAYRHNYDPLHNPLGIVARLPKLPPPEAPLPRPTRRRRQP